MPFQIPIAVPTLTGNEREYIDDCMRSGWISSAGKYVELFESSFAAFCGVAYAVACCNGTVALHLALEALEVGPGDEVIVPTLTFVATPNSVTYCGANPVFVDSEPSTWNLDPAMVEAKITSRTRGIIAVHLYGNPAQMGALREIASRHGLFLLEDAAEAHGAIYDGQIVGSIGDAAAFSFYANKIITTGEGGMVVTNDGAIASKLRLLRGQGMDPKRRYWHPVIGYNYRMMNLAAAIGLAQLEKIEEQLTARQAVAKAYRDRLGRLPGISFQVEHSSSRNVCWMFSILLDPHFWQRRDSIIEKLADQGIETRPVFYPANILPPYRKLSTGEEFPIAEKISCNGITLPTWTGLSAKDVDGICTALELCRK